VNESEKRHYNLQIKITTSDKRHLEDK